MIRWICLVLAALPLPLMAAASFDPLAMDPPVNLEYPAAVKELVVELDGSRMPGLIYIADGPGPHPTVVLLHGLPGNEKNLDIAQVLRRAGFNVVFFHYRGAWGAEGQYGLAQVDDDALAVLAFLRQPENVSRLRVDTDRLSLLGHSLGGFTALSAASQDDDLICAAAMSPANFGALVAGIKTENPAALAFLDYANTLFMLRGFNAEQMRSQLLDTPMAELDTTGFGPGLRGKSVFMVVGVDDQVTPAAQHFDPVIAAYSKEPQIKLQYHKIAGGHSYSVSRVRLTRLVLEWMSTHCR